MTKSDNNPIENPINVAREVFSIDIEEIIMNRSIIFGWNPFTVNSSEKTNWSTIARKKYLVKENCI